MSLDYRRACLEIRERFHLQDDALVHAYERLARRGAGGSVLAQTCNRMEAYCWWPSTGGLDGNESLTATTLGEIGREICAAWTERLGADADEMLARATVRSGRDAALHLVRVASGLESQVLGDIHILGQLRGAFRVALEQDAVNSQLHRLFSTAFRASKRVKRETALMATRSGVGSEAARLACSAIGREGVVVVGCGKIGSQAARTLVDRGVRDLCVVNRTLSRAERLASELGGVRAESLDALPELLASSRVVIVATDASAPVITRDLVEAARAQRANLSSLALIDVSMPRNVEPAVGKQLGVTLMDLDGLHPEGDEVAVRRARAIPEAEAIVAEGCAEFEAWLDLDGARSAIAPMRRILDDACRREIAHLSGGESEESIRAAARIVARVMAHPMTSLRSARERGEDVDRSATALESLFA